LDELFSLLREPAAVHERIALDWIALLTDAGLARLLSGILDLQASGPIPEGRLAEVFRQLCVRARSHHAQPLSAESRETLLRLYAALGPGSHARSLLLQVLATAQQSEDLRAFSTTMTEDPPTDRNDVGVALAPLFQRRAYDPALVFPALLGAMSHPSVAAPILDLCNYLTREGRVPQHPAAARKHEVLTLLGDLVQRLEKLAENEETEPAALKDRARQVDDGVSLIVALCDACALVGDKEAVGKLHQAFELKHRRVRTEAAAALARLGEADGEKSLVALAAEPVCRLRVLAYAEELGLLDRVAAEHQTLSARAEADLALWLAQPSQVGIPPERLELVDERLQFWPGYDDPVECYLFRFTYSFANGQYSNIGIAGPSTHAFSADVGDLSPDDIYAAFAGWDAQHEEIVERDVAGLPGPELAEAARLERRIRDNGYSGIEPLLLGSFFGDRFLVARATRESSRGVAVADAHDVWWFASAGQVRAIGPVEASCIYKGRKLLRSFNVQ
jgi:hypothetical protein